jgi:hypothetical protein
MDAPSVKRIVWQDEDKKDMEHLNVKKHKLVFVTVFVAESVDPMDAGSKEASSSDLYIPTDPNSAWYWDFVSYKAPPRAPESIEERAQYVRGLREVIRRDLGVTDLGQGAERVLRDFVLDGTGDGKSLRLELPGRKIVAVVENNEMASID